MTNLAKTSRSSRSWLWTLAEACRSGHRGDDDDRQHQRPGRAAGRRSSPLSGQAASCPALNGKGITHQSDITTNETWAGDGTVHRIAFGITVRPGATLTLAPCAVVQVNPGLVLTVTGTPAAPAKLVSQGTAARPVLVTSAVAGQPWGMWRGLTAQSTFDLSYTTFENGGRGALPRHGAERAWWRALLKSAPFRCSGQITWSSGVRSAPAWSWRVGPPSPPNSTDLIVTGGGGTVQGGDYAIEINPIAAGTLPTLIGTGNTPRCDSHRGHVRCYISRDLTLKDRGVPYYFVFDRVRVTDAAGATTPTLTIEPGVELRFDDYLQIGFFNRGVSNQPGKLIAVGTTAKPIVFTSSKPTRAPGDWPGVYLFNAAGSRLENVRIDYAGGPNGITSANCKPAGTTDAAALFIALDNAYVPAAGRLRGGDDFELEIARHQRDVDGRRRLARSDPGFRFEAINGCQQTRNRMPNGCVPSPGCLVPATGGTSPGGTTTSGTTTPGTAVPTPTPTPFAGPVPTPTVTPSPAAVPTPTVTPPPAAVPTPTVTPPPAPVPTPTPTPVPK